MNEILLNISKYVPQYGKKITISYYNISSLYKKQATNTVDLNYTAPVNNHIKVDCILHHLMAACLF